jgi:NAD-dependent SIR2 family protein deacetylase
MIEEEKNHLIPSKLVPHCPVCGKEMTTNLRCDDTFVEDEYWHKACDRYIDFLEENKNKKVLLLELGVGFNTPVIIKYPFIKYTKQCKNAFYICINKGDNYSPIEIKDKSLILDADINELISKLLK